MVKDVPARRWRRLGYPVGAACLRFAGDRPDRAPFGPPCPSLPCPSQPCCTKAAWRRAAAATSWVPPAPPCSQVTRRYYQNIWHLATWLQRLRQPSGSPLPYAILECESSGPKVLGMHLAVGDCSNLLGRPWTMLSPRSIPSTTKALGMYTWLWAAAATSREALYHDIPWVILRYLPMYLACT